MEPNQDTIGSESGAAVPFIQVEEAESGDAGVVPANQLTITSITSTTSIISCRSQLNPYLTLSLSSRCSSLTDLSQPNYDPYQTFQLNNDFEVLLARIRSDIVKPKSFKNEVRAIRDIESFLENPILLLNLAAASVEEIISEMLKVFSFDLDASALEEARASLYADKSTFQFTNFLQGIYHTEDGQYLHDPTWLCTFAPVNQLQSRRVVMAKLHRPSNFGPTLQAVQFVILVLVPSKEKSSKSAFEIARTFASMFSDSHLRLALANADSEPKFCAILASHLSILKCNYDGWRTKKCAEEYRLSKVHPHPHQYPTKKLKSFNFSFGKGLIDDFTRRIKYYPSDFVDGLVGPKTLSKVSAAIMSLFFACILPPLAFGVINHNNTHGIIGPKEALLGQAIGGLFFALFSGQPLVIIATTAPLCLYKAIVYQISSDLQVDFLDLFAAVGLWNAFFLSLYALFDISKVMSFCTRSTEEIFATFIFLAFIFSSLKECVSNFKQHYCWEEIKVNCNSTVSDCAPLLEQQCSPDKSILFLFLMLGTVVLALFFYNFSSTPYLSSLLRESLADYALPLSVILFSLIGSAAFHRVKVDSFAISNDFEWRWASLSTLNSQSIPVSIVLGFSLSLLFFVAQNVCASMVSTPTNHLKKGDACHWDLLVVGLLNAVLSMMGLPWIHGVLPHSPLHARLLADIVPAHDSQHASHRAYVVVNVRETRVSGIAVHVLIALAVLFIPATLGLIPIAVLCGLFLYCAISTLRNNSLYERVLLLFTEQSSYPPTHYLRHCPQRTVHSFTLCQLLQLALICFFGFAPWQYIRLIFPVIIALLIPIRWAILPKFMEEKHLSIIDNRHY